MIVNKQRMVVILLSVSLNLTHKEDHIIHTHVMPGGKSNMTTIDGSYSKTSDTFQLRNQ